MHMYVHIYVHVCIITYKKWTRYVLVWSNTWLWHVGQLALACCCLVSISVHLWPTHHGLGGSWFHVWPHGRVCLGFVLSPICYTPSCLLQLHTIISPKCTKNPIILPRGPCWPSCTPLRWCQGSPGYEKRSEMNLYEPIWTINIHIWTNMNMYVLLIHQYGRIWTLLCTIMHIYTNTYHNGRCPQLISIYEPIWICMYCLYTNMDVYEHYYVPQCIYIYQYIP